MVDLKNRNKLIVTEKVPSIHDYIDRQNNIYLSFLRDNSIDRDFRYDRYIYRLEDEYYPTLFDTMVNPIDNSITFYGEGSLQYLIHEWVHLTFPSYNCSRHNEGLANYIYNNIYSRDRSEMSITGSKKVIRFLSQEFRNNPETVFNYLTIGGNFYDTRFGHNLITRGLSNLFVEYLIHKYGLRDYIKQFYDPIKTESQRIYLETKEFYRFYKSLEITSINKDVWASFTKSNQKIQKELNNYGFPKEGSAMKFLYQNRDKFSYSEFEALKEKIFINRIDNRDVMLS